MITIKKLGFSYGDHVVLKDISMNLEEGRIYGLLGENGVGKTTLLTLLAGLKKVEDGTLEIDGQIPFNREPSFLSNIYYLPDEVPAPRRKAIDFAIDHGQYWNNFNAQKFSEIMTVFDTDQNQRMDQMSYGQLKKTFISFALACNTKYLFMDEPTNGLDIPSKRIFRKLINSHMSEDRTIVISTHQVHDVEKMIDHIVIIGERGLIINDTIDGISEKYTFGTTPKGEVLYSEKSIEGNLCMARRTESEEETPVSLELLFEAVNDKSNAHKNW